METVVQGNINPIEKVERSAIVLAATILGIDIDNTNDGGGTDGGGTDGGDGQLAALVNPTHQARLREHTHLQMEDGAAE